MEQLPKRARLSGGTVVANGETDVSSCETMSSRTITSFDNFQVHRLLNVDTKLKSFAVCGSFSTSESLRAVILAEKEPLTSESLEGLFSSTTALTNNFQNDIYGQSTALAGSDLGKLKLTTIYPATDAHIQKYSDQDGFMMHESPEDYEKITRPCIASQSLSKEWVYNILEGRSEAERVVYSDEDPVTGFVLIPDLKWDTKDLSNLYLVAIIRRRDLFSLRDLTIEHVPLLRHILTSGKEAIRTKYGVEGSQLRVYIHYQPSYYHLHVHFTHVKQECMGMAVGRAHLLDDVIDNITMDSAYYRKKTLNFVLRENSKLLQEFRRAKKEFGNS